MIDSEYIEAAIARLNSYIDSRTGGTNHEIVEQISELLEGVENLGKAGMAWGVNQELYVGGIRGRLALIKESEKPMDLAEALDMAEKSYNTPTRITDTEGNSWGSAEEIYKNLKESVDKIGQHLNKEFELITVEWFSDECLDNVKFAGFQAFKTGFLIALTGHYIDEYGDIIPSFGPPISVEVHRIRNYFRDEVIA